MTTKTPLHADDGASPPPIADPFLGEIMSQALKTRPAPLNAVLRTFTVTVQLAPAMPERTLAVGLQRPPAICCAPPSWQPHTRLLAYGSIDIVDNRPPRPETSILGQTHEKITSPSWQYSTSLAVGQQAAKPSIAHTIPSRTFSHQAELCLDSPGR